MIIEYLNGDFKPDAASGIAVFETDTATKGNYAIEVLITGIRLVSVTMKAETLTGNDYREQGDFSDAERHYLTAYNMTPNRFLPLYRLMLMYDSGGDEQKAYDTARMIIEKSVKIPSGTITKIKKDAHERVSKISL